MNRLTIISKGIGNVLVLVLAIISINIFHELPFFEDKHEYGDGRVPTMVIKILVLRSSTFILIFFLFFGRIGLRIDHHTRPHLLGAFNDNLLAFFQTLLDDPLALVAAADVHAAGFDLVVLSDHKDLLADLGFHQRRLGN